MHRVAAREMALLDARLSWSTVNARVTTARCFPDKLLLRSLHRFCTPFANVP
jgi:hypothetical protein